AVDPILHEHGLEGRAGGDRLTDDAVLPAHDVALGVHAAAEAMHVEGPILAALDVVLACPQDLDGLFAADRLRDGRGLAGDVAVRSAAPPEAAAREQRVHANVVGGETDDARHDLL